MGEREREREKHVCVRGQNKLLVTKESAPEEQKGNALKYVQVAS